MAKIKHDMTQGSVVKNLLLFSLPLFLSYFFQALYGSVDTLIVGQFCELADVTGVTQGSQITHILTQAISGLSTAGAIMIAQYTGGSHERDLEETICTLFTLFLIFAALTTVVMLFLNMPIIRLLKIPGEAVAPTLEYLQICEAGLVFIFFYNCISAILQAMGDSHHPLIFVAIACGINVVLDLVLVVCFGMGAAGTAVATVAAQAVSVVLSINFLRKNRFLFDFHPRSFRIYRDKLSALLRLGIPYAIQRGVVYCSFLAISGLSNAYGLAAASASGVVAKINNFATMPFSAIQSAIATVARQNMGAGKIERSRAAFRAGLACNLLFGGSLFIAAQIIPGQMLSLFSPDTEMIRVGIAFLRYYSLEYILMPFNFSIHALMSASGRTIIPAIDGLLASFVVRIPLAAYFSSSMGFPGIALGSSLAVISALIPAAVFYFSGIWKNPKIKSNSDDH